VRHAAPVRRALVAVDGSVHALQAVAALASMPWLDGVAEVAILGVREGDGDETLDDEVRAAAALLPRPGVEALVCHARGSVPSTILDEARDRSADLVVLGTRGAGPVRRILIGSTASAVARLAPCSVLLAHVEGE